MPGPLDDIPKIECPWCHQHVVVRDAAPDVLGKHNVPGGWHDHPTMPGVRVPTRCPGSGATVRRPIPVGPS